MSWLTIPFWWRSFKLSASMAMRFFGFLGEFSAGKQLTWCSPVSWGLKWDPKLYFWLGNAGLWYEPVTWVLAKKRWKNYGLVFTSARLFQRINFMFAVLVANILDPGGAWFSTQVTHGAVSHIDLQIGQTKSINFLHLDRRLLGCFDCLKISYKKIICLAFELVHAH